MSSVTVLEARIQNKVLAGSYYPRPLDDNPFLSQFLLVAPGLLWFVVASPNLCLHFHIPSFSLCLCFHITLTLHIRTPVKKKKNTSHIVLELTLMASS